MWYFDGQRLKSKLGRTNKCMDYSTAKGVVYMRLDSVGLSELQLPAPVGSRYACAKYKKHQQWRFDGKVFRSHHGNCLDYNYKTRKVYLNDDCHEESWLEGLSKWPRLCETRRAISVGGGWRLRTPRINRCVRNPSAWTSKPEAWGTEL